MVQWILAIMTISSYSEYQIWLLSLSSRPTFLSLFWKARAARLKNEGDPGRLCQQRPWGGGGFLLSAFCLLPGGFLRPLWASPQHRFFIPIPSFLSRKAAKSSSTFPALAGSLYPTSQRSGSKSLKEVWSLSLSLELRDTMANTPFSQISEFQPHRAFPLSFWALIF